MNFLFRKICTNYFVKCYIYFILSVHILAALIFVWILFIQIFNCPINIVFFYFLYLAKNIAILFIVSVVLAFYDILLSPL